MKTITFCKDGEAISDFEVVNRVAKFIEQDTIFDWRVSNQITIDAFRVAIAKDTIKSDDYSFFVEDFNGQVSEFIIDRHGRSDGWVSSQEVGTDLLSELIQIKFKPKHEGNT